MLLKKMLLGLALLCFIYGAKAADAPAWLDHYPDSSFLHDLFAEGQGNLSEWQQGAKLQRLNEEWRKARQSGDKDVQIAILITRATFETKIENFYKQFLYIRQVELMLGKMNPDSPVLVSVYALIGVSYAKLDLHEKALGYFKKRAQLLNKILDKPDLTAFRNCNRIAEQFKNLDEIDSALQELRLGVEIATEIGDLVYVTSAYNNLGMMFQNAQALDSAEFHFRHALTVLESLAKEGKDKFGMYASVMDNLGQVYEDKREYEKALQVHEEAWKKVFDLSPERRQQKLRFRTASNLRKLHRNEEALEKLEGSLEWVSAQFSPLERIRPDFDMDLLDLLANLYRENGENEKANEVLEEKMKAYDQLLKFYQTESNQALKLMVMEGDRRFQREVEQGELEIRHQKSVAEATRLRLYLIIALAFALILICLVAIYRRNLRLRQAREIEHMNQQLLEKEQQNNKLREEKLNFELANKKKDLTDMSLAISMRRAFATEVLNRIKEIQALENREKGQALKTMVYELTHKLNAGKNTELIFENVDQVNSEFFTNLEKAFPNLTKTEKALCSLLRLNLSNKEIAEIRNVNPSAVKMGKNRLRKKLGLEAGADLNAFLDRF